MTQMARWALSLLLPSLLWACTTGEKSTLPVSHEYSAAATFIQLDKPVHFTAPDGAPVLAAPDDYLVEQTAEAQLRLVPSRGGSPLLLAAEATTHDIDVSAPFPLLLALNQDTRNVVLLMPDGTALDAAGSLSGVQSREIVRQRRHYQLAYQLDPTTGQVKFGDGATGQRPLASQSSLSSNARVGGGKLGNLGSEDRALNFELQNQLSQYNQAEALAKAVEKARNEQFRLEYDWDRPGSDYAQQAEPNPESCRAACADNGTCQAFTFVKSPAGSSTGQCFLKRTVPAAVANPCCISGKRQSTRDEITGNIR